MSCLNSSVFVVSAVLVDMVLVDGGAALMLRQTEDGQVLALDATLHDLVVQRGDGKGTPMTAARFEELCTSAAVWSNFHSHVAPGMLLAEARPPLQFDSVATAWHSASTACTAHRSLFVPG